MSRYFRGGKQHPCLFWWEVLCHIGGRGSGESIDHLDLNPAEPPARCVIWGKARDCSEPQFLIVKRE